MKRLLPLFACVALLLPFCSSHVLGQALVTGAPPAYASGKQTITSTTPLTLVVGPGYSTVTIDLAGVTAGSATVTVKGSITSTNTATLTSTGNNATVTADGVYVYSFPYTTLTVSTTGGTITAYVTAQQSVPSSGGGSSSGGNVTIVAPTDGSGNVKVSSAAQPQPSPLYTTPVSCATPTCAVVNFPGVTVTPTATPSAMPAGQPVVAVVEAQVGTSGLFAPITVGGSTAAGTSRNSLNIDFCNGPATTCSGITSTPADAQTNTVNLVPVNSYPTVFNGTTWDRMRAAASPAPTGVTAIGFNSVGAAALLLCDKQVRLAGTTVNTLTQVVALGSGLNNYICGWSAGQVGTVLLDIQLSVGTGTNCGSTNVVIDEAVAANATNMMFTSAYGYPLLKSTAASQEICVDFLATSSTTNSITIYYTQF